MKNILLPTDFSENSWNAISYAIQFYDNIPCNFYLLHVHRVREDIMDVSPYIADQEVLEAVHKKPAKEKLLKLIKRIKKELPDIQSHHRFYSLSDYDFFIDAIRRHVEQKNIDTIVMGTKGASGLKEIIIGSNTGDVITKVKCNLLAVPEKAQYRNINEIVFATDFSLNYNLKILRPLLETVDRNAAALRILHMSKNKTNLNTEQQLNRETLQEYFNNTDSSFHYVSNSKLEDAVQSFVENRKIDLIFMVAKNLNYCQQILFHSKIEKISYHINIPFLVLHEIN
ncbi:universal stress protein [Aestuariivivens sediminicola]|uniref:universal stress protein n=1 Tax=Aestuariivivens sediminicola TaxID=2913560 RepID=UPI001F59ED3C|nr:universal stress protein [Aestuariivivens sediminicola]